MGCFAQTHSHRWVIVGIQSPLTLNEGTQQWVVQESQYRVCLYSVLPSIGALLLVGQVAIGHLLKLSLHQQSCHVGFTVLHIHPSIEYFGNIF